MNLLLLLFNFLNFSAYGNLTVRSLLDTIEHYLREFDFPDPFLLVRKSYLELSFHYRFHSL